MPGPRGLPRGQPKRAGNGLRVMCSRFFDVCEVCDSQRQRNSLPGHLFVRRIGSGSSFASSGEFVTQVLRKFPDILAGACEAKIVPRKVADTEVRGDRSTSRRESDK